MDKSSLILKTLSVLSVGEIVQVVNSAKRERVHTFGTTLNPNFKRREGNGKSM